MRKIIYLSLVFLILGAVSCKKEDKQTPDVIPPVHVPNYYPLEIGNYWVYENYQTRDGQEELMDELDSIIVVSDTMIRYERYFILDCFIEPFGSKRIRILRDSLGYITDPFGRISFTMNNPGDVFYHTIQYDNDGDTVIYQELSINPELEDLSLPAGDFVAINRISDFIIFPGSNVPDSLVYRSTDAHFIDGIGQATDFLFYASGSMSYEKQLLRYHIEPMYITND